jgi:2-(1,2-epoxy-1,2-dihydrophenyl)acetyl-CoA isomerase
MTELVTYERTDGIAVVRLNRPDSLNALTAAMVDTLAGVLDRAITEQVSAVILAGNGRAFCAGHDLRQVQDPSATEINRRELERIQDITRLIQRSPHPVIAAVHRYALGAGFEFALGCDLVLASADTEFGFPEVAVGLSVTGGVTRLLPMLIGAARAKELILLGGRFPAARAYDLGLVNEVVEGAALMPRALEIAAHLASLPQASLRAGKRSIDLGLNVDLEGAMHNEVQVALSLAAVDQRRTAGDAFRARAVR